MGDNNRIEDLLADEKFQDWVINSAHQEYWVNWQKANPSDGVNIEKASSILRRVETRKNDPLTLLIETSWENLRQILLESQNAPQTRSQFTFRHLLKYAAVIGVLMVCSIALFKVENSFSQTISYQTSYGEKKAIVLEDGTKVTLNANSTLVAFTNWRGKANREVELVEGEAFFNVTKKPTSRRPEFKVKNGDLDIVVLGTKFNVKNRRGHTEVALEEGRVQLRNQQEVKTMSVGEVVAFSQADRQFLLQGKAKNQYAWLKNKLVFEESSLQDIALIIEDTYGKTTKIENNELLSRKLSGEIPNDNLEILLMVIESSLDVKAELKEDQVIIKRIE